MTSTTTLVKSQSLTSIVSRLTAQANIVDIFVVRLVSNFPLTVAKFLKYLSDYDSHCERKLEVGSAANK